MQDRLKKADLEAIKNRLRSYSREDIEYNEPHFSIKLAREKIDKKEVIKNLLKPDKLVLSGISKSKNPSYKHVFDLYFRLSKNRIFKIPASMKSKSLYLITIFKIRRRIQDESIKYYQKAKYH